jgi:hypothetical protein
LAGNALVVTPVHQKVSGFHYPGMRSAVESGASFSQTKALKIDADAARLACMLLRCRDPKQADASQ